MSQSKTQPKAVTGGPVVCARCKKDITPVQERVDFFRKGYMTVAYHAECFTKEINAEPDAGT